MRTIEDRVDSACIFRYPSEPVSNGGKRLFLGYGSAKSRPKRLIVGVGRIDSVSRDFSIHEAWIIALLLDLPCPGACPLGRIIDHDTHGAAERATSIRRARKRRRAVPLLPCPLPEHQHPAAAVRHGVLDRRFVDVRIPFDAGELRRLGQAAQIRLAETHAPQVDGRMAPI